MAGAVAFVQGGVLRRYGDVADPVDGISGVDTKVGQDLVDLGRVHLDGAKASGGKPDELDILPDEPVEDREHSLHGLVQVENLGRDGLFAGEGEKLAGQVRGTFRRLADTLQVRGQFLIRINLAQGQLCMAKDHAQHVVEVVGDPSGQTAYGFHLLGLGQLALQLPPLLFGPLPIGDVPDDTPAVSLPPRGVRGQEGLEFSGEGRSILPFVLLFGEARVSFLQEPAVPDLLPFPCQPLLGGDDRGIGHGEKLIPGVPKHFTERCVRVEKPALVVQNGDSVSAPREEEAVLRLALSEAEDLFVEPTFKEEGDSRQAQEKQQGEEGGKLQPEENLRVWSDVEVESDPAFADPFQLFLGDCCQGLLDGAEEKGVPLADGDSPGEGVVGFP